jgi:uncharacterized protein YkwD
MKNLYLPNMKTLVDLHNDARKSGSWLWKIDPLIIDEKLMFYAYDWAETMSANGAMVHSKMRNILNLGFKTAAENIAWGQPTEKAVMKSWLLSPGHRTNIMSASYNKIGCSASYDRHNRLYWCVCFARD